MFRLLPLPPLQVDVGSSVDALDFDDFVERDPALPPEGIAWSVRLLNTTIHALPAVQLATGSLRLTGLRAGIDTLLFRARGPANIVLEETTTVTVVEHIDERRQLRLSPLPDIQFVAGATFVPFDLDDFILDRDAHPDSVVRWGAQFLGSASALVQVRSDRQCDRSVTDA